MSYLNLCMSCIVLYCVKFLLNMSKVIFCNGMHRKILRNCTILFVLGNTAGYVELANADKYVESLERRLRLAEGHVEAGRLLAYYQACILPFSDL